MSVICIHRNGFNSLVQRKNEKKKDYNLVAFIFLLGTKHYQYMVLKKGKPLSSHNPHIVETSILSKRYDLQCVF